MCMLCGWTELLDYLHVVTKNQSEKVMTKIVDFVSGSPDMDFLERSYHVFIDPGYFVLDCRRCVHFAWCMV